MEKFMEVIYDDEKMRFDLRGPTSDDTLFVNNVILMKEAGMKLHCQIAAIGAPDREFERLGYVKEPGLYDRLLNEYEIKTGTITKRW